MGKAVIKKMPPQSSSIESTGIIEDMQSGTQIPFQQAYGPQLGLAQGIKVNYQTVTTASGVIANALRLIEKGQIQVINSDNQTGTLLDNASGNSVAFNHSFVQESGISVGSIVNFETVSVLLNGITQNVAVALVFIRN